MRGAMRDRVPSACPFEKLGRRERNRRCWWAEDIDRSEALGVGIHPPIT